MPVIVQPSWSTRLCNSVVARVSRRGAQSPQRVGCRGSVQRVGPPEGMHSCPLPIRVPRMFGGRVHRRGRPGCRLGPPAAPPGLAYHEAPAGCRTAALPCPQRRRRRPPSSSSHDFPRTRWGEGSTVHRLRAQCRHGREPSTVGDTTGGNHGDSAGDVDDLENQSRPSMQTSGGVWERLSAQE